MLSHTRKTSRLRVQIGAPTTDTPDYAHGSGTVSQISCGSPFPNVAQIPKKRKPLLPSFGPNTIWFSSRIAESLFVLRSRLGISQIKTQPMDAFPRNVHRSHTHTPTPNSHLHPFATPMKLQTLMSPSPERLDSLAWNLGWTCNSPSLKQPQHGANTREHVRSEAAASLAPAILSARGRAEASTQILPVNVQIFTVNADVRELRALVRTSHVQGYLAHEKLHLPGTPLGA